MKKIFIATLIASCFTFFGCKEEGLNNLVGTWNVCSFEKEGQSMDIFDSHITFEDKGNNVFEMNGNSGVNSFFGDVSISEKGFQVSDKMGSTKMMGAPDEMVFEDNFIACLIGADSADIIEENGEQILKIKNTKENLVLSLKK